MTTQARLTVAGVSAVTAKAIQGIASNGMSGAGTTQATATPLQCDVCKFSTVGANSGAIIPPSNSGDSGIVYNAGANALSLYPPVGAIINGGATNAAYSIATA